MDEATQRAWEAGAYARCLRDAKAANAQQAANAAALWAACFDNAELWLNHDDDEELVRPTEYEAIKRVFRSCTGAKTVWQRWLDERDAALYGTELATLADVVADHRARPVQLPLPSPLGVAA